MMDWAAAPPGDRTARGCGMTNKGSEPEYVPPPNPGRFGGPRDPFRPFERLARDDGKPYKPPEPKAELQLLSMLGSKGAMVVMYCLLVAVVGVVLGLLVARM
jgi:hypothetical protein